MSNILIFKSRIYSLYFYKIQKYFFYLRALVIIFNNFKNPILTIKKIKSHTFPFLLQTKSGKEINVLHKRHLSIILKGLYDKIDFKNNLMIINFKGQKIFFCHYDSLDLGIFLDDFYSRLEVENKIVVDIGGNIGDSALLYAFSGASKVIMLEPQPKFFEYASSNIKHNKMSEKIDSINSALGSKHGTIKINYEQSGNNFQIPIDDKDGLSIPILTLDEIISQYVEKSFILKMDCEGCENDVLLSTSDEILKKFDAILIEFHFGCLDIVKKLSSLGFKITILNSWYTSQKTFQGHLLAEQK